MTFDLGVWKSRGSLSAISASRVYADLCRGIVPDQITEGGDAVETFYSELTATWPDADLGGRASRVKPDTPWAAPLQASSRFVLLSSHWQHAELVLTLVTALASRHRLTVFDPQSEEVYLPDAEA